MTLDLATIGIAIETTGLEKGAAALKILEDSANRSANAADKTSSSFENFGKSSDEARKAAEKLTQQIDSKIKSMQIEADTFGMSARQAQSYTMAMNGANLAQINQADGIRKNIEAMQAGRAASAATEKLNQGINDQIKKLQDQADTFGMSARQAAVYKLALDGATESQLKQANAALKSVESLETARKLGEDLGRAIKVSAVAIVAGVTAAAYAFEKLIGNIAKYQDLAEQTGGDPAGLASLRTAADVGGASIESLVMAANRMQLQLAKVDDESKGVGKALAAIGIHVEDFKKLRADEQLRKIGKALNKYADGGEKVAVIQAAMGRGAASLLPAFKELGKETEANNRLTTEQIQLADEYKDAQARTRSELMQMAEALAIPVLSAVTELTGAMKDVIKEMMGVGSEADSFKGNTAIASFAQAGAIAIAELVDGIYNASGALLALKGSLNVIAADVGTSFNFLTNAFSAFLPGDAFAEQNAKLKASLDEREKTLKDANDRYARLSTGLGLADNLRARFAQQEVNASFGGIKPGEMDGWDAGKPKIEFKPGADPKGGNAAASEANKYASALQALEQQLGKANEQTQEQKTQYQLLTGSLKTLTDAHGRHLLQIAKEIDLKAQWAAVSKAALDYAKALADEQLRADEVLASFNSANSEYLQQLEFETSLVRLTAGARQLATAERQLDMDYQRKQIGLNETELATLTALYQQQKSKLPEAIGSKVSGQAIFDHQEEAKKQLDAFFDPTKAQTFGEALKGAFGGAAESMGRLSSVLQAYGIQQAEIDKARTAATVAYANDAGKLAQAQQAINEKEFATRIGGYADMAGAAKGFFKEGSDGYKTMDGVSKAFHVAQMAMNAVEMGQKAIAAVLNQAGGDPYTAFPRMAAMAAAVGALGFAVGGGFSGGGGDAVSSADRQKAQGTGTVLGDSAAKSASLLNALEAMEKNTFTQLKYSSGMLDALKSIQRSMAGLAQIIFRTNGLTSGNPFGVKEGTINSNKNPLLDAIGAPTLESLFGITNSKVTKTVSDSGLSINGSLADLTRGRGFGQYADVRTDSSSYFGLVKKSSTSTQRTALDQAVADQLGSVFAGISSSLQIATTGFGADAASIAAQLAASVISIPAVSLRGLKGAELQEALNAVFSGAADKLARTVAPGFEVLQKAGEGYFETVIRASTALATANGWMERLDQTLFGVSTSGAIAATSLADLFGGINEFNAASQAFYQDYFTDAERAAQSTKEMAQALGTVNLALPGSKEDLRALAGTLDLTSDSGRKAYAVLLNIAPEFSATADLMAKAAQDTAGKLLKAFASDSIDFAGLRTALAGQTTDVFVSVLGGVFDQLAGRIKAVVDGIANERAAVRDAVLQINPPGAMSRDEILRGIAAAGVALPSGASLAVARGQLGAADKVVDQRRADLAAVPAVSRAGLDTAKAALDAAGPALRAQLTDQYTTAGTPGSYFGGSDQRSPGGGYYSGVYTPGTAASTDEAGLQAAIKQALQPFEASYTGQLNAFNAGMGDFSAKVAAAQLALAHATSIQSDAVSYAQARQLAYSAALQNFTADASKSVTRLSKLREETVRYHDAQKQLADLMSNSAKGLRDTVRLTRIGQLDSAQSLTQKQADFAKNYSLALSTTGAAQAGYADKLGAALPDLNTALMDVARTREEWAIAASGALAQSEKIAALLEANAPKDYAADSLAMLGQIDATLTALDQSSKSAEKIISDAVNAGSDKTAAGLRAVIAALTGQAIPAFAAGGSFAGGLRIVGENGPELEATGPSRIFNAAQTRSMLNGGGNTERLEALVENLTQEVQGLRFEARSTAIHTSATTAILKRVTPDGDAMATRVAA